MLSDWIIWISMLSMIFRLPDWLPKLAIRLCWMAEYADWLDEYPGYGGRIYLMCWLVCCLCFAAMVNILVGSAPSLCWLSCLTMLTILPGNAAYVGLLCRLARYEDYDV
jgi:hypothetical protein